MRNPVAAIHDYLWDRVEKRDWRFFSRVGRVTFFLSMAYSFGRAFLLGLQEGSGAGWTILAASFTAGVSMGGFLVLMLLAFFLSMHDRDQARIKELEEQNKVMRIQNTVLMRHDCD